MSVYSQGVKTRDVDPNTFNQSIATFKLPANAVLYPNLRLFNIGCSDPANTGKLYNQVAGCYSLLKNIVLTSQGMEIDACRNVNRYLAFTQFNNSNENNLCVEALESKNNFGFEYSVTNSVQVHGVDSTAVVNVQPASSNGYLDLRKALPILNNISVLPTNILKNLVLTIEFELDSLVVVKNPGINLVVERPILIYDQVDDPVKALQLEKAFQGVVWNKIEHDQISVASNADAGAANGITAASKEQVIAQRLEMFSNKFISRMLVSKMFQDKSVTLAKHTGNLGSIACNLEKFNVKVDGARIFPADIEKENTRLALLCDAYGEINMPPYGNNATVGLDDPHVNAVNVIGVHKLLNDKQGKFVGNLAYYGFALNSKVQDVEINFSRTSLQVATAGEQPNNPSLAALNIHAFAEVRKALSVQKDGSFRVGYL